MVAAFFSSATTLGTAYSFGAFFQSMSDEFGTTRGATAVVFGATTFTFFWLSLVTGRLVDRYGPKPLLVGAAVSLCAGLWATSTVGSLTVGYLTYGAGVGIAAHRRGRVAAVVTEEVRPGHLHLRGRARAAGRTRRRVRLPTSSRSSTRPTSAAIRTRAISKRRRAPLRCTTRPSLR